MLVVAIVLAVALVAALISVVVMRSRLRAQSSAGAAATSRAEELQTQLGNRTAELENARRDIDTQRGRAETAERRADAGETRAATAEQQAADATSRAMTAEAQAAATAVERDTARRAASDAAEVSKRADQLVSAAERTAGAGLDPGLLWSLERARTERLWRENVALGPEPGAAFDRVESGAAELRRALEIEVETDREVVGAVVDLHADIDAELTPAGPLLALRAAQELLARVVHTAEHTDLTVSVDGRDLLVTVSPFDDEDRPLDVDALDLPVSPGLEVVPGGLRLRNVVAEPAAGGEPAGDEPAAATADES